MTENSQPLFRQIARSRTDRIWWWMSMLAYTVAVILKISGAPLDKATYWVLVGIFATLQALYWQREDDRA